MGRHSSDASRLRLRRARALLASGLVLGVGGAVTLAAWNDSEHSQATFTASTFNIEGSVDGSAYAQHDTSGTAAVMQFGTAAASLSPGAVAFARLQVRTTANSIAGTAVLTANGENSAGLGQYLRYGVRQLPAGLTCNAQNYEAAGSVAIVPPNTPLHQNGTGVSRPLAAAGASPINYCFRVTMQPETPTGQQGASMNARWIVTGTSS